MRPHVYLDLRDSLQDLGHQSKVDWFTCGVALCLAAPLFAWAFLAGHYPALAPGVGLVLLAPLIRRAYYASR